jgi:hypothetical protein
MSVGGREKVKGERILFSLKNTSLLKSEEPISPLLLSCCSVWGQMHIDIGTYIY